MSKQDDFNSDIAINENQDKIQSLENPSNRAEESIETVSFNSKDDILDEQQTEVIDILDAVEVDSTTPTLEMKEAQENKLEEPVVHREYFYKEEVKKQKKKYNTWPKIAVVSLIVSIIGGTSIGAGYGFVKFAMDGDQGIAHYPVVAQSVSTGIGNYAPTEVIKAVKPTVVSISTQISGTTQYFGSFSVPYESNGVGSGVMFHSDESHVAIATNNHVIEEATSIYVTLDGDVTVPAKVVGTKSEADLAVITVDWKDLQDAGINTVSVATFGDSDALQVGDSVIAIGNAMGMGLSATDGIISMTEQIINVDGNELTVLQTSAAINGGNSGGALVNSAGEVIGINTAKYNSSMAEGMGYAIPSNEIIPIIEELLLNGTQPKPYIGITGTSITADNASLYRLPVGALIMEVIEGGPADMAGIMVGDIITQFNGSTVMDMEALISFVNEVEVGKQVDVHVIRDGESGHDLKITIGDKNS